MKKDSAYSFLDRFKSIRPAYILSFTLLIIAALVGFAAISMNYTYTTAVNNAATYTSHITTQVNASIDSYIENMLNVSDIVMQNSDVQQYLFLKSQSASQRKDEYDRLISQFSVVLDSRTDIYNIAAVSDQNVSVVNRGDSVLIPYDRIARQTWFKNTMANPNGVSISTSHVQNAITSSYQWVVTLSRPIVNKYTSKIEGIFFIDLNYSAISNLCNDNKIGDRGYIFIIDSQGNLIYHPQQQLIYGGLKNERIDEVMQARTNSFTIGQGDDARLYTKSSSDRTGWTTVGVFYTAELTQNDNQTLFMYIAVAIGIVIIALFISDYFAHAITRPLFRLLESMKQVEKGKFTEAKIPVTSANEIGQLTEGFNSMTERIDELVKENIKEQEEKRKSELKALQSQITPHFLYNTLDSIIWMAEAGKNEEVVQMTAALSRLFRQGISVEDEVISLQQEIDYCKSYLLIQGYRFQNKISYEVSIDPEVRNVMIVKMVLQPIIENAINHGLKLKPGKGTLSVHACREGNDAKIYIRDDGVGMDAETLAHIFERHAVDHAKNGVGIYNVQKRLKLYYGETYGISYESVQGEGTTATVTIPMEKEERHEEET